MPTAVRYSATIADVLVLGAAGQDFPLRCEVRIVGDEKKAIVDALNAPMDEARRSSPSHGENRGSSPLGSASKINGFAEMVGRDRP